MMIMKPKVGKHPKAGLEVKKIVSDYQHVTVPDTEMRGPVCKIKIKVTTTHKVCLKNLSSSLFSGV